MNYLNPPAALLAVALLALPGCIEIRIETAKSATANVIMNPRPPVAQPLPPVAANSNQPLIDREASTTFETATFALG